MRGSKLPIEPGVRYGAMAMSDRIRDPSGTIPPYRVLLCGSNYGRAYLEALAQDGERFRLVGLLARGSERSRKLADRCDVPLFRAVEELPTEIDLACAALPTSADAIVLEMLQRGIHVLCEHPRREAMIAAAYRAGSTSGVCFHINGHFTDLPAPRAFIARGRDQAVESPPRFVHLVAQERGLYAALDILRQAMGRFEPVSFGDVRRSGDFTILDGELAGARASMQVQVPPERPADGSPSYLVDINICLGFDHGVLSLSSLAGPVLWNVNLSRAVEMEGDLWQIVSERSPMSLRGLKAARDDANMIALERLIEEVETGLVAPQAAPEPTLQVAEVWERLGAELHRQDS